MIKTRLLRISLLLQRSTPPLREKSRPTGVTLAKGNRDVSQEHCRSERMKLRQKETSHKTDNWIPRLLYFRVVVTIAPQVHTTGRQTIGGTTIR